jgi:hypothetical protein
MPLDLRGANAGEPLDIQAAGLTFKLSASSALRLKTADLPASETLPGIALTCHPFIDGRRWFE